ncbi:MAG TPA: zinc metalloprotease HtpX [Actinomycetota bacterium]|jgi:heat shock protein HtpX|nr:zinc metalloprotease HtpX [Actinomycetota bacterium]
MARTRFPPDFGLSSRMLLTMFLLGLVYVAFMAVLIALKIPVALVVVIAVGFLLFQYFFSDRIALFAMRGREVTPQQAPELHELIDRLCALADMPKPRVAIAQSDIPNAFATGRNPKVAVVCVTTGIMRKLDKPELEAVLSHELSHVAHRDVAVMTIASFLGLLAGFVVRMAFYGGVYGGGFGGYGRRDSNNNDSTGAVILLVVLASAVVYALSFLLTRALSRYRELSADRAGAMLIGRPSLLASALVKVSGDMARIPTRDLRAAEPLNAFFFAPAIAPGFSLSSLFSTHPSLEQRLERLSRLEAELGRRA